MSTKKEFIKNMPKVELHLHLEGAFTFELLFKLINKYGRDPAITNIQALKNKFVFKDFSHFIDVWFWKNQFFRIADDFEESTYFTLENLHKNNVIYAEVFYSPWDFEQFGLRVEAITEATLYGIQRAKQDFGITCHLIADLCRDYGAETAINRFRQIIPYRERGLIGIGLGGSEQKFPPEPFEKVYHLAAENGFHRVAHAGEACGAESIWGAIQKLNVERIGHGVRAVEDPNLITYLKDQQIPLEICVTSNLKTAVFPSLENHPIKQFFDNGLFVTINSDDPSMFGASVSDEYLMLYEKVNFSLESIKKLSINAALASFLSDEEKQIIIDRIDEFWNKDKIDK